MCRIETPRRGPHTDRAWISPPAEIRRLVVGGVHLQRRGRRLLQHTFCDLFPILARFRPDVQIPKRRQRRQIGRGEYRREHATMGLQWPCLPALHQRLVQEYGKGRKIQSFLDEVGQSHMSRYSNHLRNPSVRDGTSRCRQYQRRNSRAILQDLLHCYSRKS